MKRRNWTLDETLVRGLLRGGLQYVSPSRREVYTAQDLRGGEVEVRFCTVLAVLEDSAAPPVGCNQVGLVLSPGGRAVRL